MGTHHFHPKIRLFVCVALAFLGLQLFFFSSPAKPTSYAVWDQPRTVLSLTLENSSNIATVAVRSYASEESTLLPSGDSNMASIDHDIDPTVSKPLPSLDVKQYDNPEPRIDLVLISDRGPNATMPLRAFVNSLLSHTSEPINLNIITQEPGLPWLDVLNKSESFSVFYHHPSVLTERTERLLNETEYSSKHYSAFMSSLRLFLPALKFPPGTASKVLMMDDDIILYEDLAPLIHHIRRHPEKISLSCPVDPRRVEIYFTSRNRTRNGHTRRFCLGGWMGLPLGEATVDVLTQSLVRLTTEYPASNFRWSAADQDVINRYLADFYPAECDDGTKNDFNSSLLSRCSSSPIDLIPCDWSCDFNSCGMGKPIRPPQCNNCPNITRCRAFHFLRKSYSSRNIKKWLPRSDRWGFYNRMDSMEVLGHFVQRLANRTGLARD
jgi:hypothetical protein